MSKNSRRKQSKKNSQSSTNSSFIIVLITVLVIGGFIFLVGGGGSAKSSNSDNGNSANSSVVSTVDGKQIIEVTVSGGYSPGTISAKAGVPSVLRMKSDGAYGCERAFNIPKLGISEVLPESGNTDFDLGAQAKGAKVKGTCRMGMYTFVINFS